MGKTGMMGYTSEEGLSWTHTQFLKALLGEGTTLN